MFQPSGNNDAGTNELSDETTYESYRQGFNDGAAKVEEDLRAQIRRDIEALGDGCLEGGHVEDIRMYSPIL